MGLPVPRNGVSAYLDDGYSVENPDEEVKFDDQGNVIIPYGLQGMSPADTQGIPGMALGRGVVNQLTPPEQQVPDAEPPPATAPPTDAPTGTQGYGDDEHEIGPPPPTPPVAPVGPTAPRTQFGDLAQRSITKILGDDTKQNPGPPVMQTPKWWERAIAGGIGAAAGWSNAASRARTPIDIKAATEGILHPGYAEKMAQYQSQIPPLEKATEIAGQVGAYGQKMAMDQSEIDLRKAQADYARGMGRTEMIVTPELERLSKGVYRAGTRIPTTQVGAVLKAEQDRIAAKETTFKVTDPDLAAWIGVKPGDAVPISTYNAGLNSYRKPEKTETEAQVKDGQIKADFASQMGKDPAAVTPAEMNAARRMFGSGDQLITSMSRSFIAKNHRLPNAAEEEAIVNAGIRARKQDITITNAGGTATDLADNAEMIANYQTAPLSGYTMRTPEGRKIMAEVKAINPDYHAQYFDTFRKTEMDATTGRIATSANALDTMMGHLSVLDQAAQALHNSDLQALNKIANFFNVQTGKTAVSTYQAILHRLGPEITRAYVASGGSIGERNTNEEDFAVSAGPKQIRNNIAESARLADSKIKALQDQYNRGTYGRGKQKLISEEAEATRQRLAGGGGVGNSNPNPSPNSYIVGHRYGGLLYLGGDANNQASWKK